MSWTQADNATTTCRALAGVRNANRCVAAPSKSSCREPMHRRLRGRPACRTRRLCRLGQRSAFLPSRRFPPHPNRQKRRPKLGERLEISQGVSDSHGNALGPNLSEVVNEALGYDEHSHAQRPCARLHREDRQASHRRRDPPLCPRAPSRVDALAAPTKPQVEGTSNKGLLGQSRFACSPLGVRNATGAATA